MSGSLKLLVFPEAYRSIEALWWGAYSCFVIDFWFFLIVFLYLLWHMSICWSIHLFRRLVSCVLLESLPVDLGNRPWFATALKHCSGGRCWPQLVAGGWCLFATSEPGLWQNWIEFIIVLLVHDDFLRTKVLWHGVLKVGLVLDLTWWVDRVELSILRWMCCQHVAVGKLHFVWILRNSRVGIGILAL